MAPTQTKPSSNIFRSLCSCFLSNHNIESEYDPRFGAADISAPTDGAFSNSSMSPQFATPAQFAPSTKNAPDAILKPISASEAWNLGPVSSRTKAEASSREKWHSDLSTQSETWSNGFNKQRHNLHPMTERDDQNTLRQHSPPLSPFSTASRISHNTTSSHMSYASNHSTAPTISSVSSIPVHSAFIPSERHSRPTIPVSVLPSSQPNYEGQDTSQLGQRHTQGNPTLARGYGAAQSTSKASQGLQATMSVQHPRAVGRRASGDEEGNKENEKRHDGRVGDEHKGMKMSPPMLRVAGLEKERRIEHEPSPQSAVSDGLW